MATPIDPPSFRKFPYLPFELRDQIWHEALPSITTTLALYFYRKRGYWQPFELSKYDEGYRAEGGDNLGLSFRTELIDSLDYQLHPLVVSLLWVNHEARRVALKWMDEQVEISPSIKSLESTLPGPLTKYSFSLPFGPDPDIAALYIPRSKWTEFYHEPADKLFEPGLRGKSVQIYTDRLTAIAIPEAMIGNQYYFSWLPELIDQWHNWLRVVYVILEDDDEQRLWSPPEPETTQATSDWAGDVDNPPVLEDPPMGRTEAILENAEQGPWGWELIPEKYQFTWFSHWGEMGEIRPFIMEHALKFEQRYEEWVAEKAHLGSPCENSDTYNQMMREIEPLRKRIEEPVRRALEDELSTYNVKVLDIRPVRVVRN